MPRPTNKAPSAEQIEKEKQALELRRAGVTYDVIAERVGFSDRTIARRYVMRALGRTLQEPADDVRRIEVDRLDRLQRALWPAAMQGDDKAIGSVLKVMDRRAKLLGLDAPVRTNVTLTDSVSAEIEALAAQLGMGSKPAITVVPDG